MKKSICSLAILGVVALLPMNNINDKSFPEFLHETVCFNSQSVIGSLSKIKGAIPGQAGSTVKCNIPVEKKTTITACLLKKE